jgi:hypothetical protein
LSRDDDALVEVICTETEAETAQAIRYDIDDNYVWIPKSLIHDSYENEDGTITIQIPEWFAEKEGLV